MVEIPIILLAAGSSSRMGRPKQLLPWGKQTLIEHQILTLLQTGNPVNVVLGAHSKSVIPVIKNMGSFIFHNPDWEQGMGSSIASGIVQLSKKFPAAEGVLITLLDQPLVTAGHLKKILQAFQPGKRQIIVSQTASGWKGVPVLFDKFYFEELKKLRGENGAKTVVQKHMEQVTGVYCDDIPEDMDTPESYRKMWEAFQHRT